MASQSVRRDVLNLIARAASEGRGALSEPDAKQFVNALGIPVPRAETVRTPGDAAAAAERIGLPVVVKAVSPILTHKTDIGAVVFPVASGAAATNACDLIAARVARRRPDVVLDGFLIEAYRPAQPEWILALRLDPHFGPVVMFGLGGVFVEALHQVSFRLAPLQDRDIEALLSEQPSTRILAGLRGVPADLTGLKQCIRTLSDLAKWDDVTAVVSEVEINPLTVTDRGVLALDALVVLRSSGVQE